MKTDSNLHDEPFVTQRAPFRLTNVSRQKKLPRVFLLTLRDNNRYSSFEVFLRDEPSHKYVLFVAQANFFY